MSVGIFPVLKLMLTAHRLPQSALSVSTSFLLPNY